MASSINKYNKNTIGFAGYLENRKDPMRFARIYKMIKTLRPELNAVVAGKGPLEEKLKKEGVEVRFYENMDEFYGKIDILVITSKSEGLPYVLLEALKNGIPVVSTPAGELTLTKIPGVYIAEKDEDFVEKILMLYREKPGITLPEDFSVKKFFEKWEKIIEANTKKKILVFAICGIGDFIEALPYLYELNKKHYMEFIAVKKLIELLNFFEFKTAAEVESEFSRIPLYEYPKILKRILKHHDIIINLKETKHPFIMKLILKLYSHKISCGFENFYTINIPEFTKKDIARAYKELFSKISIKGDFGFIEKIPYDSNFKNSIVVFTGGERITRRYPLELWKEVIKKLNDVTIITDESQKLEIEGCEIVRGSIIDVLKFIKSAKLILTNDTFAMHAAYIFGKKFVAIMPASEKRFFPGGGIMLKKEYPCSPCYYYDCPKKPYKGCHYLIKPEEVLEAVKCSSS